MSDTSYMNIVRHYERCLEHHGAGPRAVDWKSETDAAIRYDVMLDVVRPSSQAATLLDFGCGLGGLREHMVRRGLNNPTYSGLEISPAFAAAARQRHPDVDILGLDVMAAPESLPEFDYIVMNGVFTRRESLSHKAMLGYFEALALTVFGRCRLGLAFNVMSSRVDWTNETLFHPDHGELSRFVGERLSRHFVLRNDYGLHESTVYVYRHPTTSSVPSPRPVSP